VAYYRCRAVGIDSNSNEFASAWGTVQQVLITSDGTWWLKAIDDPSLNVGSVRVLRTIDITMEEPYTIFRPLGEDRPIVVSGVIQGQDGGYSIRTVTEDEWDALYPILVHQGILLSQDPYNSQKYIRIYSRDWNAEKRGNNVHRDINIRYVEVDG